MSIYLIEFFSMMILIILGVGVVANVILRKTKAEGGGWMVITTGWGFAVMIAVFCGLAMGAKSVDINPVFTLIKLLLGIYQPIEAIAIMISQIFGAFVGSCIVWIHFGPHWAETDDSDLILAVFATGPAIRKTGANLASEIIGTVILVVSLFSIGGKNVIVPGLAPYLYGIVLWSIGISLGGTTGYALNPARDLGPRLAHAILPIPGKGHSAWEYAWIPIVGPFIGALIGYAIIKVVGII